MAEWLTVDPPNEATAPAGGLLAALGTDPGENGWEHGIVFRSERSGGIQLVDPCEEALADGPEPPPQYGWVPVSPVTFRMMNRQQGLPHTMDTGLIGRQVQAMTSEAIARELWTGDGTRRRPYDTPQWMGGEVARVNSYLADGEAGVVDGGPHEPMRAIALIEQAAKTQAKGLGQVLLHVPSAIATMWGEKLDRQGNMLRTKGGTPVIADDGYPGTGPGGAAGTWIYATGPVAVRLGAVRTITDPVQTTDRRRNRRETWGLRTFSVGFDPTCHLAVQVDFPTPSVTFPTTTPTTGGTP